MDSKRKSFIVFALLVVVAFLLWLKPSNTALRYDPAMFFQSYIINPLPSSIKAMKYYKDPHANGIILFTFKADRNDLYKIVLYQKLHSYDSFSSLPDFIKYLVEDKFSQTEIFGEEPVQTNRIFGRYKKTSEETQFFFIFVSSEGKVRGFKFRSIQ